MSEEILSFGLDNNEIKGSLYKKYQGKENTIDRCGLVYWDIKKIFSGSRIHFGGKRYFLCKKGFCCEKLGDSRYRIAAVLIKYATDQLGNLKTPLDYEIVPWFFSEQTYKKLQTADSEFPLGSHDIKISCTNEEYQHLTINCCKESIWQAKAEFKNRILEEAKACYDWTKRNIASNLSVEEIKDLLSEGTGGSAATDPTSSMNLDDVLKNV